MGWRSWNLFGANVDQGLIEGIMDGMVSRKRTVDGLPTSLCDLGYCDVGLDDNWQQCCAYGADTFTYHTEEGAPVVNTALFPDMLAMTNYAHALGLTAGWYGNNCICQDHCGSGHDHSETADGEKCYQGDVAALFDFGFDAVKLDGCGKQRDLQLWSDLINATGKAMTIENCHWGLTVPHVQDDGNVWCPWNFYRTSQDVRARYESVIFNLEETLPFANRGLSFPGCWAYPDMLEVGCAHGPGGSSDPGLTAEETRSHFGAWCIVSSPLTLSMDVNNDTIMDAAWPIVANTEAIAINQVGGPQCQLKSTGYLLL
jgi:alpha-galactosidase